MKEPIIESALYLEGYQIEVSFTDGIVGVVDLSYLLWGPVFEPLKDINKFKSFVLNQELNTISWPNGADVAPESLYQLIAV